MHAHCNCQFASGTHLYLYRTIHHLEIHYDMSNCRRQYCFCRIRGDCNYGCCFCIRSRLDICVHPHGNLKNRCSCSHQLHLCRMHTDCNYDGWFCIRPRLHMSFHCPGILGHNCSDKSQWCFGRRHAHCNYLYPGYIHQHRHRIAHLPVFLGDNCTCKNQWCWHRQHSERKNVVRLISTRWYLCGIQWTLFKNELFQYNNVFFFF